MYLKVPYKNKEGNTEEGWYVFDENGPSFDSREAAVEFVTAAHESLGNHKNVRFTVDEER